MSQNSYSDQQLAAQLRQPTGDMGRQVGNAMNESNGGINRRVLQMLQLQPGASILEIGPGNGGFVPELLQLAPDLNYTGLDWSQDMVELARERNQSLQAQSQFVQGNSNQMPFNEDSFDWALTVNTLYFWDAPQHDFAEIRRVLKASGRFCLAFADVAFMAKMQFTQYNFRHYEKSEVVDLLQAVGFQFEHAEEYFEAGQSNTGESVQKHFHLLLFQANSERP